MASPETREALGGRRRPAPVSAPTHSGASNEQRADREAEILDEVKTAIVHIGGKERRLNELAPRYQRRLTGLFTRIGDEARSGNVALDQKALGRRFIAIINERFTSDVLELAAVASGKPGELAPQDVSAIVQADEDAVSFAEVGEIMMALLSLNGFLARSADAEASARPT